MTMTLNLAHSSGMDAANRRMTSEGRNVWTDEDFDLAARTALELFPLCAEGYRDICECPRHKAVL